MTDEEAFAAEEALKSYINGLSCKSLNDVHRRLRVLITIAAGMIESIEQGRTEEVKQH